ncbi:MAG: hypothetical protein NC310_06900 [Roseburia sp.]|nr:hypothetical protein [Anaeroplasma bactoclasticum]MCM1196777.1 hypothetical protein [Roseburia sp.]MCM1556104.1 hypothetical protein [Anaeroplasma bactoclasticum]
MEFYLLEDVVRLYEYRLKNEKQKIVDTVAGKKAKNLNLEKFTAIINIFKAAIEVAWAEITSGNYSSVWKAIPEHALMKAAGSTKYLPELKAIAVDLLKALSNDSLNATLQNQMLDSALAELEDHEANVRRVKGIPSTEEIEEIIKAVELIIPDKKKTNLV